MNRQAWIAVAMAVIVRYCTDEEIEITTAQARHLAEFLWDEFKTTDEGIT